MPMRVVFIEMTPLRTGIMAGSLCPIEAMNQVIKNYWRFKL
jgi:hypothetical protein